MCRECGHEAKHHNAKVKNPLGCYIIEGCSVIDIQDAPFPPWWPQSLFAGQHRPCPCKWNGKSKQKKLDTQ
jgi:hypothetical protein